MNHRILCLFDEPSCNSDDEKVTTPDNKIQYYIVPKTIRSDSATQLAREIDKSRLELAEYLGQGRYHAERLRIPAPPGYTMQAISKRLPDNTPLDWFSPSFFNRLPASFRVHYRDAYIALPLAHRMGEDPKLDWKTMDEAAFMEKYGNEVKAQYKLPTDEEVEAMKAADADVEDDDGDYDQEMSLDDE